MKAEQEWTNFIFQLQPDDYAHILQSCSQNVVMAFAALVKKNNALVLEHRPVLLHRVNEVLAKWYQLNGTFRREQGDELKPYVENTLGAFLGNSLKLLFRQAETSKQVGPFLDKMESRPHYRLYLYYRFIESVAFIDNEMNYVDYRTMLTNFENSFIPRIFEVLSPFFINISDTIDVNELASLQSSLSFNDPPQKQMALEFSDNNKFTELVFQLLSQVISYHYGISLCESEKDYDL